MIVESPNLQIAFINLMYYFPEIFIQMHVFHKTLYSSICVGVFRFATNCSAIQCMWMVRCDLRNTFPNTRSVITLRYDTAQCGMP